MRRPDNCPSIKILLLAENPFASARCRDEGCLGRAYRCRLFGQRSRVLQPVQRGLIQPVELLFGLWGNRFQMQGARY